MKSLVHSWRSVSVSYGYAHHHHHLHLCHHCMLQTSAVNPIYRVFDLRQCILFSLEIWFGSFVYLLCFYLTCSSFPFSSHTYIVIIAASMSASTNSIFGVISGSVSINCSFFSHYDFKVTTAHCLDNILMIKLHLFLKGGFFSVDFQNWNCWVRRQKGF